MFLPLALSIMVTVMNPDGIHGPHGFLAFMDTCQLPSLKQTEYVAPFDAARAVYQLNLGQRASIMDGSNPGECPNKTYFLMTPEEYVKHLDAEGEAVKQEKNRPGKDAATPKSAARE